MVDKPTKEELAYWERVLHDHRLGKDRGRSSKVDCIGGSDELANVERVIVAKKSGRSNRSKGARPE